ncbi:RNA-dependent RNA polymerase [Dendrolimus punctatus cypovirus 22]|uniref:RNA-dependent RNA polymerase n=1 Tax=Dendrolimus punctatus cypovirus 22 TaxID=1577776 RepID=UPI00053F961D|nr:RNA-dependent RNA polymerase [Dendrolimus punctatus cypovirus 22]AIY60598.1 RNA-dependent RNA polymerase [Dendrolimus punctatus cypovirus 22]
MHDAFTPQHLSLYQDTVNVRINDFQALFEFISGITDSTINHIVQPVVIHKKEYHLRSLNFITHPRPFRPSMYPLNNEERPTDFSLERPYNYLCTFGYNSFLQSESLVHPPVFKAIHDLITQYQLQTRGSDIWRNLASFLDAADIYFQTKDYPVRQLLKQLLSRYSEFPFNQSSGKIAFTEEAISSNIICTFPSIIYMLSSLPIDVLARNLSHEETLIAINNYLFYAEDSIFDTYLLVKSKLISWVADHQAFLGEQKAPILSLYGDFITVGTINCGKDLLLRRSDHKSNRKIEYPEPSVQSWVTKERSLIRTLPELIRTEMKCRLITNTRMYLATLLELGKEAGSGARSEGITVIAPFPTQRGDDGDIYELQYQSATKQPQLAAYWQRFREKVINKMNGLNMNQEYIDALTTNSSGHTHEAEGFSRIVKRASKIRIINAALSADEYALESRYNYIAAVETKTGVRFQIARRARQIFIISNDEYHLNIPTYVILKKFLELTPYAALGKQTGGLPDIAKVMATTTMGILHSSSDVAGMDASLQRGLQLHVMKEVLDIASQVSVGSYGPFNDKPIEIQFLNEANRKENVQKTALSQCVARTAKRRANPITFKSLFGRIVNENMPFGSGLASTSANHTALLIGILRGNDYAHKELSRALLEVLGDDVRMVYVAPDWKYLTLLDMDQSVLNDYGFKLETSASFYRTEFLQQSVCGGHSNPYPERLSIPCAERVNIKSTPRERCEEDFQLLSDLANRSMAVDGLAWLAFVKSVYTNRRVTFWVLKKDLPKFRDVRKGTVLSHCYIKILPVRGIDLGRQIVQITLPIFWLFIKGGGEMPYPSLQRADGTFTPPKSLYGARGEYCNRILYELSRGDNKLNHEFLEKYSAHAAFMLAQINFSRMRHETRSALVSENEINKLSAQLQTHGDTVKQRLSREAYDKLLSIKFRLPRQLVYAFQVPEKIRETLLATEVDKREVLMVSPRIVEIMVSKVRYITENEDMKKHRYDITYEVGDKDRVQLTYPTLFDVALIPNALYPSPTWMLIQACGIMTNESISAVSALGLLHGKYGAFRTYDRQFEYAQRLWRTAPEFLDDFFIALNLNDATRQMVRRALQDVTSSTFSPYFYSLNNRQLMVVSPNFNNTQMLYKDIRNLQDVTTIHGPYYSQAVPYLYILANCLEWCGELLTVRLWQNESESVV